MLVERPVRLERSPLEAVAGESVEDLLGARVPGDGVEGVVPMARIVGMPRDERRKRRPRG